MKQIVHKFLSSKKFFFSISGFVILMVPSCIITRSEHKVDDGSTSLTKSDSLAIQAFSISDFNTSRNYSSPKEIIFQVIDAEQVNKLVNQQRYSWILLGASWCPVSKYALIKFNKIINNFRTDSIRLIIISQDFNIPVLQQELFDAQYTFIPYLLNPDKYGRDEVYKQEKFAKDLLWDLPLRAFKGGGVPMNIIVDNRKQVKYLFGGSRITVDSISKYTGLAKFK